MTGSKCAASMSTSRVEAPTSVSAPPMTPAIATTRSPPRSVMTRSPGSRARSTSSSVVSRSPARARRTTTGPCERGEVEGVQRLAEAEHDVVRDVDRQRDRPHAGLGEPGRHPPRGRRGDVDAAHDAGDVAVAARAAPDRRVVGELDGEAAVARLGRRRRELEGRVGERRAGRVASTRGRCRAPRSSSRGRA